MADGDAFVRESGGGGGLFGNAADDASYSDLNFGPFRTNPVLGIVGQLGLDHVSRASGTMPTQFMPTQSIVDQAEARQYRKSRQEALSAASGADAETYVQTLRGLARATGRPFGVEQARAAKGLADNLAKIAPVAAQMAPEWFDAMHGSKGSATVMANFIHSGGRFAVDPVTGKTGMSGESAGALAKQIQAQYFGPNADLAAMRGISAGQAGMMYDELQRRGVAPPSIGSFAPAAQAEMLARPQAIAALKNDPETLRHLAAAVDRGRGAAPGTGLADKSADDQVKGLTEATGDTEKAIRSLQKTDTTRFEALLRGADMRSVGKRIQTLSGAVSAIRDIFGDAGHPNAPMHQLVEGLGMLTQGGLTTMAPAELERSLRVTQQLAKSTGVGLDAMQGLVAQGARVTDALGIERGFAVQGAQGAAAYGLAAGQVGGGHVANFFAKDRDQKTLMDERLRIQAADSENANQIGAAARVVTRLREQGVEIGGPAAAILKAVEGRETEYVDPATGAKKSLDMSRDEFLAAMTASGVSRDDAAAALQDREANREHADRTGAVHVVRRLQGADSDRFTASIAQAAVTAKLQGKGVDRDRAALLGRKAAEMTAGLTRGEDARDDAGNVIAKGMTAEQFRSPEQRTAIAAAATRKALEAAGATKAELGSLTDADMVMVAENQYGDLERANKQSRQWKGYGSYLNQREMQRKDTLDRAEEEMRDAESAGAMRSAVAGIGQAGPLRRLMDTIQDPPDTFKGAVAKALGGQDPEVIRERLARMDPESIRGVGDRDRLKVMMEGMMDTAAQYKSATALKDPKERRRKHEELTRAAEGLVGGGDKARAAIAATLEAHGLKEGDLDAALAGKAGNLTPETVKRLQALKVAAAAGGVAETAAKADVAVGVKVATKDTAEAVTQGDRLFAALADGGEAVYGEEGYEEEVAARSDRVGRHAKGLMETSESVTSQFAADEKSIAGLGSGGLDLVKGARAKQLELHALAQRKGRSVEDLVKSLDPEAVTLAKGLNDDLKAIHGRQDALDRGVEVRPLDKAAGEDKALAAYVKDNSKSDAEKNEELVANLVKETGGDPDAVDAATRKRLAGELGAGPAAELARHRLESSLDARGELDKLAKAKKISPGRLREALAKGSLDGLDGAERLDPKEAERAKGLATEAGSLLRLGDVGEGGEGLSTRAFTEAVRDYKAAPAAEEPKTATGPSKINVTGTVTIKGDKLVFEDTSGVGSTPL